MGMLWLMVVNDATISQVFSSRQTEVNVQTVTVRKDWSLIFRLSFRTVLVGVRCDDEDGERPDRLSDDYLPPAAPAVFQRCEYLGADPGASRSQQQFSGPNHCWSLGRVLGIITGTQTTAEWRGGT